MRKLVIALAVLVVLGLSAASVAWWKWHEVETFAQTPTGPASELVVQIPSGAGPKLVSEKLAQAGVVSDAQLFLWNVRYRRKVAGKLKAGEYLFKAGVQQTPDEIIERLLKGEVLNVKVTIPEGLRLDEQAPLLEQAGIGTAAQYIKLARDAQFARQLGIEAEGLEGYLFPDTYLVPRGTSTEQMIRYMVERFRKAWTEAQAQRAADVTLSLHQAVTLASIVEKETGQAEERPRISCVFHNRLKRDMKLQTDPTVIYSVLLRKGSFDGNLHRSDLDTPHPYNTYAVKGLPPGPIANAGAAALAAALHPLQCNDLFFVSKNDGTHVFCPDLACHEANVEKWQREFFRKKQQAQQAKRP